MTSHFHPHLPGTFGADKMASICVVSSNCLNYPRQCFEGIVSFNQLEQRLYFTIVQKTHPIPPYKFCSSYTKNRNFLTAKILFKIITALIVRYSRVKNCLLLFRVLYLCRKGPNSGTVPIVGQFLTSKLSLRLAGHTRGLLSSTHSSAII